MESEFSKEKSILTNTNGLYYIYIKKVVPILIGWYISGIYYLNKNLYI